MSEDENEKVEYFYVLTLEYPQSNDRPSGVEWVKETLENVIDVAPGETREDIYWQVVNGLLALRKYDVNLGPARVLFFSLDLNMLPFRPML